MLIDPIRIANLIKTSILLSCISITAISLPSTAANSNNYLPDISTFLQIGDNSNPQYNLETGEIFFKGGMTGTSQLYRINEFGWPYQLTVFADGIEWYKISPDGSKVIIGVSTGGNEQTQLFLVDAISGRPDTLTNNPDVKYESVFWNKNSDGFYYRSNLENSKDFKIYSFELNSGVSTKLFDMEGSNAPGDISYDGNLMIIYHMISDITNDLYLLDLASGQSRLLVSGSENVRYSYPSLSADNNTLYMICDDNGDGIMKRATLDIPSGRINFPGSDSRREVEVLDFSRNRKFMVWTENRDGYSTLNLWDIEKNLALPTPQLEGRIENPRLMDDGRLLFTYDNPTRTSDIWEWNWQKQELKQKTFATYAGIDRNLFAEPKLIEYTSFDGLEIPAFLYLPSDYNGGPIPFIVLVHGGPAEQFLPYFVRNFQYFILNGFGLLVPNIRGSLGYGKDFADFDNYKNRMDAIKDIKAGVDYLLNGRLTEPGKIGILGSSYGGFVVLASIIEYPDLFSAAIDRSGISNFVTYLENTKSYRKSLRESEYGPSSDTAFLQSISPLNKAHLIKTPLLVVHGANDVRVPIGEARQIIRAIENNNGIVDSLIFSDEGHILSKQVNRISLFRKVVDFFNKYLKNSN